jgi:hypothetical protein
MTDEAGKKPEDQKQAGIAHLEGRPFTGKSEPEQPSTRHFPRKIHCRTATLRTKISHK